MLESRLNSASQDGDGLVGEVGQEELRLISLNFAVLNGNSSKKIVQLNLDDTSVTIIVCEDKLLTVL